ncbi:FkbM family methyltransferase [Endothiovibrio diazotrophicus]
MKLRSTLLRGGIAAGLSLAALKRIEYALNTLSGLRLILAHLTPGLHLRSPAMLAYVSQFIESGYGEAERERLVAGLDGESRRTVETFLGRVDTIYRNNVFRVQPTADEWEGLRQIEPREILRRFPDIAHEGEFAATSFWALNGLRFLDRAVIDRFKGGAVIDGGAYVGDSALVFRETFDFGRIWSFEPDPANQTRLEGNLRRLAVADVEVAPVALGARPGTMGLISQGGASCLTSSGGQQVEVTTLDRFVEQHAIERVGVIKLDVEGAEYDVLLGAEQTIRSHCPLLCISIYHNPRDFFEIRALLEAMADYHFIIRKIHPDPLLAEIMLIGYPRELQD